MGGWGGWVDGVVGVVEVDEVVYEKKLKVTPQKRKKTKRVKAILTLK